MALVNFHRNRAVLYFAQSRHLSYCLSYGLCLVLFTNEHLKYSNQFLYTQVCTHTTIIRKMYQMQKQLTEIVCLINILMTKKGHHLNTVSVEPCYSNAWIRCPSGFQGAFSKFTVSSNRVRHNGSYLHKRQFNLSEPI